MTDDRSGSDRFVEDLTERSASNRAKLSENDRTILRYLRSHPADLAFQTSSSLADATRVSQAAVVRLSKKLGFQGFTEMRDALRENLMDDTTLAGRFARRSDDDSDAEFEQDVRNLQETGVRIGPDLERVARLLTNARRVFVAGTRESFGLALFMHRRLHIVLRDVRLIDPSFPDDITCLEPEDALFACIFPRYSRLTATLLETGRSSGAQTIVLTDDATREFLAPDDTLLVASTESSRFHWSMVAPMAVIEAVVAKTAAENEDTAKERLQRTDEFKRAENFYH